jgi:hypothetical protein
MAQDDRDYLLKNHIDSTNKNLDIYNPKEYRYRTRTDFEGHQFAAQYLEPHSKWPIFWRWIILISIGWIIYAIVKIIPLL